MNNLNKRELAYDDTGRLEWIAAHSRALRSAQNGKRNLCVWGFGYPHAGATLTESLRATIDREMEKEIQP